MKKALFSFAAATAAPLVMFGIASTPVAGQGSTGIDVQVHTGTGHGGLDHPAEVGRERASDVDGVGYAGWQLEGDLPDVDRSQCRPRRQHDPG